EIKKLFAPEIITGLARIDGRSVGIIANQPRVKGGVLFPDSADKAAKFIQLCDAFNIPLLFLMDIPGFMIGTSVEKAGIIRHGAKMLAMMREATVPRISVVVRRHMVPVFMRWQVQHLNQMHVSLSRRLKSQLWDLKQQ